MPSVIQRGTEILRFRSVAPVDVPSPRTRNVPEGRWVLRAGLSIETTRIAPTTPATQRRTCSLGNAAVCAPPSPSMERSIAAKPIRDKPTTIKRGADDMAWARVRECTPSGGPPRSALSRLRKSQDAMDECVALLTLEPRLVRPGAIGDRLVVEEVLRLLGVRQQLPFRRLFGLLRLRRRCLCVRLGFLDGLAGRLDGGDDDRDLAAICVPGQDILAADPFLAGFPD